VWPLAEPWLPRPPSTCGQIRGLDAPFYCRQDSVGRGAAAWAWTDSTHTSFLITRKRLPDPVFGAGLRKNLDVTETCAPPPTRSARIAVSEGRGQGTAPARGAGIRNGGRRSRPTRFRGRQQRLLSTSTPPRGAMQAEPHALAVASWHNRAGMLILTDRVPCDPGLRAEKRRDPAPLCPPLPRRPRPGGSSRPNLWDRPQSRPAQGDCQGVAQRIRMRSSSVQRGGTRGTALDVPGDGDATESQFRNAPVRLMFVSFPYWSTALGRLLVEMSRRDCPACSESCRWDRPLRR